MDVQLVNKDTAYIIEQDKENITFFLLDIEKNLSISSNVLKEDEILVESNVNKEDGIIAVIEHQAINYYLHIKNKNVFITPYLNGISDKSIDLKINVLFDGFQIRKTKYSYKIIDQLNNAYEIDYKIFSRGSKVIDDLKRKSDEEPFEYIKIQYKNCISFLEYKINSESILLRTMYFSVLYNDIDIKFTPLSNNKIQLKGISNSTIKRSDIHKKKEVIINPKEKIPKFEPILLNVNNLSYIIEFTKNGKIKINYDSKFDLFVKFADLKSWSTSEGIIFKGDLIHNFNNIKVDTIVNKHGVKLASIEWINAHKIKFCIPNSKLIELIDVHNALYVAYGSKIIYPLKRKNNKELTQRILCYKNYMDSSFIARITLSDNYAVTSIPISPIYSKSHQFKIKLAHTLAPFLKMFIRKNVNLYFEKDASAANESGFVTFEEVKKSKNIRSINKYVLDSTNSKFNSLKNKYGKDLIKRFSFKHYLYIFLADNFISSELSNHVLSVRVFHELLLDKIRKTPLYFLQHGIMFAKPVDNPMALGFHKENQTNNLIKTVISSDLEAKEFYKMGYNDEDLMKTGLPKLDKAYLNENADKIAFMPTWRYWEEGMIFKGEIENTTYYKTLMEFVNAFKKAGLLDRLLLVPHNKFADYIKENFKEYEKNISTNPTEALKESIIFITDYSSIIYDATYRGAFPIFYWKEKDYLIEKYKAIPPVNEENAPGMIAYNEEELISIIKDAINNDYKIPDDIKEKYLRINEFNDNKNTERVINELIKLKVL